MLHDVFHQNMGGLHFIFEHRKNGSNCRVIQLADVKVNQQSVKIRFTDCSKGKGRLESVASNDQQRTHKNFVKSDDKS